MPAYLSQDLIFGPFRVNIRSFQLLRNEAEVHLRPQALRALIVLCQNQGKYVDHEEMIRSAWAGSQVSRHNVAVTVLEIKKALRGCSSWIRYRPRLGYSLIAPASEGDADEVQVRKIRQRWLESLNSKDPARIKAPYAAGDELLVIGAKGVFTRANPYRNEWRKLLASFPGPIHAEMRHSKTCTKSNVSYGCQILEIEVANLDGKPAALTLRISDVLCKIEAEWCIVHEHVSLAAVTCGGSASICRNWPDTQLLQASRGNPA
jgi:DNA-binding winged helix-turn-helix (wHTH) protein